MDVAIWRNLGPSIIAMLCSATSVAISAVDAQAACNLIPQTAKTFDAAVGATNRPFAAPGEPLEILVRPCDGSSPGLTSNASDVLVTVLFTPSGSGTKRAVVLTTAADCSGVDLTACNTALGGANVSCVSAPSSGMQILDP